VPEPNFVRFCRQHEVAAEQSSDRLGVISGNGRIQMQGVCSSGVPLPSQRCHGEAVAQQPGIARTLGQVFVAAVDER